MEWEMGQGNDHRLSERGDSKTHQGKSPFQRAHESIHLDEGGRTRRCTSLSEECRRTEEGGPLREKEVYPRHDSGKRNKYDRSGQGDSGMDDQPDAGIEEDSCRRRG